MKIYLIVQTTLNLFAAVCGKDSLGRLACGVFGVWGVILYVLYFWN